MARPNKYRRICELPRNTGFGPLRKGRKKVQEPIVLTIDEYEVLRLIDYEELNQVESAKQMNVARSTIQRDYNIARRKLAAMLVEGRDILIEGGNYELCKGEGLGNGCGRCQRHRNNNSL